MAMYKSAQHSASYLGVRTLLSVLRRLLDAFLTLFAIATLTFVLVNLVPGNPLQDHLEKLPANIRANMLHRYGLDKPVLERYVIAMTGMLHGDFGTSIVFPGQTVTGIIADKWMISARLGVQQMLLGVSIGLLLGIIAGIKHNTAADYAIVTLSLIFISLPTLVFGLLLQKYLGGGGFFPIIGWPKGDDVWFGGFKYTVLPTLTGCFGYIASYSRLLKTSILDVLSQDYILTARSKGISDFQVIRRHILRNSFIPVMTSLPMSVAMCITGSFFTEQIFAIPGIGKYYITAMNNRDMPVILGETVIFAALYIFVIAITDILYTVVDPRIKIGGNNIDNG
jgi:oligopeptide transport system permease protein